MKRGRWAARYGVAAAVMLTAIALTRIPLIGPELGPVIFLAMFFSVCYGGIGPGLFATLLFEAISVGMRMQAVVPAEPTFIRDLALIFFVGAAFTVFMESLHGAHRRAEASRQGLSAVLTSIGDALIATDEGGRVLFMNPAAESLCGWPAAEAVSRSLDEVFRVVDEQTLIPVEGPSARVLAEGEIVGLANHPVLISRDGAERPIDDNGAPIRGADG